MVIPVRWLQRIRMARGRIRFAKVRNRTFAGASSAGGQLGEELRFHVEVEAAFVGVEVDVNDAVAESRDPALHVILPVLHRAEDCREEAAQIGCGLTEARPGFDYAPAVIVWHRDIVAFVLW